MIAQPPKSPLSSLAAIYCCSWPIRRKLRIAWLIVLCGIFMALPLLILEMQKHQWSPRYSGTSTSRITTGRCMLIESATQYGFDKHARFVAWFLAGLFVILGLPITMYEIALHLEYYSKPCLQRHIIRILLMPPIYALDAWFCLRFINARTVLTPIRECYEAYTIYNFFMYLIRYLDGQLGPVSDYMASQGTTVEHICPMQYFCQQWSGKELYRNCRNGVLNYVILRPATAVVMWLTLVTDADHYEEGIFQWDNVWPYVMIINNFSQAWALYVLMLFYMAMHTELLPLNPLRKFVTIKLVVFFSFWQGLVITLLCSLGILKPHESMRLFQSPADFSGGIQDFIICIEMFFATIGFAWSFPPRDYMTGEPPGFWKSVYALFDLTDVVDDVQGRVHEEYHEITTRPVQKIMAPLRNNPLFSKSVLVKSGSGEETELVPLTEVSRVQTNTPFRQTTGQMGGWSGLRESGLQHEPAEGPGLVSDRSVSSGCGDAVRSSVNSVESNHEGGTSAVAALPAKQNRSNGRSKLGGSKLLSHVD